jgi:cysteinyl-tRNA synthetase
MRLYNSLTRTVEEFRPRDPGQVGLYTCGPTVHDFAHIGNFRAYAWEDLLRRHLEARGFQVHHVMNITDVEDKIIRKAAADGVSLREYTDRFTAAFFEDAKTLRLLPAHVYPRATEHIPEMIELVLRLEAAGHTYISDGSVYYRIGSFPGYGRLSGLDPDSLRAGVRVDADEYEKDDPSDFVLWKAQKPGEPAWDSPWGPGRPGWHIECSAMAMKYLGESFDLHTGGVDNKFPHHENEIAQSEGATGQHFVRHWMHCSHLIVNGEKMAKSLGNFYTLRDLLDQGHEPRVIRYLLVGTHYRNQLDYSEKALEQGRAELSRIDNASERIARLAIATGGEARLAPRIGEAREAFFAALDDDLNVSGAMGEVFQLVRDLNAAVDRGEASREDARAFEAFLADADRVFGVLQPWQHAAAPPAEVVGLLAARQAARAARNWAESDRLRDAILAAGFVIEDTKEGPQLKRRAP